MQTHAGPRRIRRCSRPSVGRYAQGMIVEVPLQLWALPGKPTPADLHVALEAAYAGERFVEVASGAECAEPAEGPRRRRRLCRRRSIPRR